MSEWQEVSLGDISTQRKGINYKSEDYSDQDSGHPFITIKCFIKGGGYEPTGIKYYNGFFSKSDWLEQNDILFSITDLTRAGDIVGSPLQVPDFGNGCLALASMDCMKIVPNPDRCDQDFLYHRLMLSDIRRQMVAYSAGSTVLHLDTKKVPVMGIRIPVALREQKAIANILNTIDQAIEKTEALIRKYQQIKAGLMHDLFTRGLTADGKLRLPREQAPELYQETPIGWMPKEWVLVKAGNIISSIDAGKSPECPDRPAGADQWGVLKVSAVSPDGLKQSENKVIEKVEFQNSSFIVKRGDLLITRANTPELVGMICHVGEVRCNLILSDKTLRLHIDSNQIDKRFLYWSFQHHETRKQVEIKATGSSGSMKNISQKDIRNIVIGMPGNIDEQCRIKQRLDSVLSVLNNEKIVKAKLVSIKSGLMHDLLTGKVPVTIDQAATAHV